MKKLMIALMFFTCFNSYSQFNSDSYKVASKAGTAIAMFINETFPYNRIKLNPIILYMSNRGLVTGCGAMSYDSFFYCPADNRVYLSENKANEIYAQFGDGGLFNVIAHEYGHLIQNQYSTKDDDMNLTVLKELRADCLSGVFFNWSARKGYLERGDYENSVGCLAVHSDVKSSIEDLAKQTAHGGVNERRAAFETGYRLGSVQRCYATYSSSIISQK